SRRVRARPRPRCGTAAVRAGPGDCSGFQALCEVTAVLRDEEGRSARGRPAAAAVLPDPLAPRPPRPQPALRPPPPDARAALARPAGCAARETAGAVGDRAARHRGRRLPDGRVYRASPAEYWVPLEGVFGLLSPVDPMGGHLACTSRHAAIRRPPEDIGRS